MVRQYFCLDVFQKYGVCLGEIKYLGSTILGNGDCDREVKNRVQAAWNRWRKICGILGGSTDKGYDLRAVVRPAMMHGLKTPAMTKRGDAPGSSRSETAEVFPGSDK